jgi:hypothetical protein
MFKIAHRGNINGPNPCLENKPEYILQCLNQGYNAEIDVRVVQGDIYLGHDAPKYKISFDFLKNENLWCHCKNIEALKTLLLNNIRCFFHDTDETTLTSDGYIWTYPGKHLTSLSICVMPETTGWNVPYNISGVCSDYIGLFK